MLRRFPLASLPLTSLWMWVCGEVDPSECCGWAWHTADRVEGLLRCVVLGSARRPGPCRCRGVPPGLHPLDGEFTLRSGGGGGGFLPVSRVKGKGGGGRVVS